MASLQLRGDSWSCIFCYRGKRHWMALGEVPEIDAQAAKSRVEYLLRLIKQRLLSPPPGCDIVAFMQNDGKPPKEPPPSAKDVVTLGSLRDAYLRVHSNGTLEKTTLDGITQHFKHWTSIMGEKLPMQGLALGDLQQYVDRRARMKGLKGRVSPATINKEIVTLRTAWNWAVQFGLVTGRFPQRGIRYPRDEEKRPFMTWDEIERRIAAGEKADDLWECLYLRKDEIAALLNHVKAHANHAWIYPLFCFAAYTGARRSEIIRAAVSDLDFTSLTITIREKKRVRGKDSTRRAPMTPFLRQVLEEWLAVHPGGPNLFCHAGEVGRSKKRSKTTGHQNEKRRPSSLKDRMATVKKRDQPAASALTRNEVHDHFKRVLAGTKWERMRGLHTLRHSFISACASKGVDQRLVQEWAGHMNEATSKRYRHLYPSTQQEAIRGVFG